MRALRLISLSLIFLVLSTTAWAADDADAVVGQWLTAEGKARVEIVKHDGVYDGRIVWLKEPTYPVDDKDGGASPRWT